jgi:hypothetical protein
VRYFVNGSALPPHPDVRRRDMSTRPRSPTLDFVVQDLRVFLTAVVVGGLTAVVVQSFLRHWTPAQTATDVAFACATTITGAAHARFVHRQPLSALGIGVLVGLPIVYAAMLLLHAALRGVS